MESSEQYVYAAYGISARVRKSIGGYALCPHNSIIITNKRILIIAIPIPGGHIESVAGPSSFFMISKIVETGNQMMKSMNPDKLLNATPDNISINLSDIKKIKFKNPLFGFLLGRRIIIYTNTKKYSYMVWKKGYFEELKKVLSNFSK